MSNNKNGCNIRGHYIRRPYITVLLLFFTFIFLFLVALSLFQIIPVQLVGVFVAVFYLFVGASSYLLLYSSIRSTSPGIIGYIQPESKLMIAISNNRVNDIHAPNIDELKFSLWRMGYITGPNQTVLTQEGEQKVLEDKQDLRSRNITLMSLAIATFAVATSIADQSLISMSILIVAAMVLLATSICTRQYIEW